MQSEEDQSTAIDNIHKTLLFGDVQLCGFWDVSGQSNIQASQHFASWGKVIMNFRIKWFNVFEWYLYP